MYTKKNLSHPIITIFVISLLLGSLYPLRTLATSSEYSTSEGYLSDSEYDLLTELFETHLQYFFSNMVITSHGLPLTAYKPNDRARYGWSNPTEWGYYLQAMIAASERGIISQTEAVDRIAITINSMIALQEDPNQNYSGMFYPFYTVVDSNGVDLPMPVHDANTWIPSGDLALLFASLTIAEGWAKGIGNVTLETGIQSVKNNMDFRMFLFEEGDNLYLSHLKNAQNGELSPSRWDVLADESGVVIWVAYLSDSITFEEFKALTRSQIREPASWQDCMGTLHTVKEAAWFNAMFPWGVRSLAGFPIGAFDSPSGLTSSYSTESFIPTFKAHWVYGDCLGIDYPFFSDAMTQGLVGSYTPPNLANQKPDDPPDHVMPHAIFVPLNTLPDMDLATKNRLFEEIEEIKNDMAGYYHNTEDTYPFGFEVVASPYKDDLSYTGADEGRPIFETLSQAYIVLSLFNALQLEDHEATFYDFAAQVPGYEQKIQLVLNFLYPTIYLPIIVNGSNSEIWTFEREAENPFAFTTGQLIQRTNASGEEVHGQVGCIGQDPWSAQEGQVEYFIENIPQTNHLYLNFLYSKNSPSTTPILAFVDNEARATINLQNLGEWNQFDWSGDIDLGFVLAGDHTISLFTNGQPYCVVDLDKLKFSAEQINNNPTSTSTSTWTPTTIASITPSITTTSTPSPTITPSPTGSYSPTPSITPTSTSITPSPTPTPIQLNLNLQDIKVLNESNGLVFGYTLNNSLLKSQDCGLSWTDITTVPLTDTLTIHRIDTDNNNLYLATSTGVLISSDAGSTFSWSFYWGYDASLDVQFNSDVGWVAVENWGGRSGPNRKLPEGNWELRRGDIPWPMMSMYWVAVDPLDPANIAYIGGVNNGRFRTLDAGVTWEQMSGLFSPVIHTDIVGGIPWAFGNYQYSTDSGVTWGNLGISLQAIVQDETSGLLYAADMNEGIFVGSPSLGWNYFTLSSVTIKSLDICNNNLLAVSVNGLIYIIPIG